MRGGFSLIEFMVYLAMFTLMMGLAFHFMTSMHIRLSGSNAHANWLMSLYSAQEAMAREMERAPAELENWKKTAVDEVIFTYNDEEIGFSIIEGKLVRLKGNYDKHRGWRKRHKSVVAMHMSSISLSYDIAENCMRGIRWELVGELEQKPYTINQYVAIRNQKKMQSKNENNHLAHEPSS